MDPSSGLVDLRFRLGPSTGLVDLSAGLVDLHFRLGLGQLTFILGLDWAS